MSSAARRPFVEDAWQTSRNARTLRAYMALQNKEIGERIAALREQRRLSQETVAARLKVAHRTIQSWELGEAKPGYRNLERLAEFYGVTEDYILTGASDGLPVRDSDVRSQLNRMEERLDRLDRIERQLSDNAAQLDEQFALLRQILDQLTHPEHPDRLAKALRAAADFYAAGQPEPIATRARRGGRDRKAAGA